MKKLSRNKKSEDRKIENKMLITLALFSTLAAAGCNGSGDDGGGAGGSGGGPGIGEGSSGSSTSQSSCARRSYGNPNFRCDCSDVNVDIPFNYSLTSQNLFLDTSGGPVNTALGPWGAHVDPFTGHFTGNFKSDWQAIYADTLSTRTELRGDGDGVCEEGETCGVHRDQITSKPIEYVAPGNDFYITQVYVSAVYPDRVTEFHNAASFVVIGWLCNYRYSLGYINNVGRELRNKMLAAGYDDPDLETDLAGPRAGDRGFSPKNLITGAPIVLSKGEIIGQLQIRTEEIDDFPNYYKGWGGIGSVPYAPLEYNVDNKSLTGGYNTGMYKLLPQDLQDSLEDIFYADAQNGEDSVQFSGTSDSAWLWKAQMKLSASAPVLHNDYSSIFSWLGGWSENNRTKDCVGWDSVDCDQRFAIFKIHKDTPFYDSSLYDSADVSYLVNKAGSGGHATFGEVITPSNPNPLSGTLLIKWRTSSSYQRISYSVEEQNQQMKIRWGSEARSADEASQPTIPKLSETCDGVDIACMDHVNHF